MSVSRFRKTFSFLFCLLFSAEQVLGSAPSAPAAFPSESIRAIPPVQLPESLGRVIDYFPGTSEKVLIHIQDAHSSLEAQKSIQAILRHLVKTRRVRTLFLEGAARVLEPELYDLHPDPEKSIEIAGRLVEQAELTGAEMTNGVKS